MPRKTKLQKVLERYLPRGFKPERYNLEEMIRGIEQNHRVNPFQFERDYKMLPELEKLRQDA